MATLRDWLVICHDRVPAVLESNVVISTRSLNGLILRYYPKPGCEHPRCHDQIREHKTGHAKWQEDGLAIIFSNISRLVPDVFLYDLMRLTWMQR